MKKSAYITIAALLCCACTVESPDTSNRTSSNIAALSDQITDWTANGPAYDMNCIAEKSTIWADGWDTTFTGTIGQKLYVKKAAQDSTWYIKNAEVDETLNFEATIRMCKEKSGTRHEWDYSFSTSYDEGNKYTATVMNEEGSPLHYSWVAYLNGLDTDYYMVKKGIVEMSMFYDGSKMDWAKVSYNNNVYSYQAVTSQD